MINYLIRRSLQMILTIIFATFAIFVILNAVPGGPLSGLNQTGNTRDRLSDEQIARIEQALGLNKPLPLRYLTWVAGEDWVDDVAAVIGRSEAWANYQTPRCIDAGRTNAGAQTDLETSPCGRGILRFDFGVSWQMARGQEVSEVIWGRLGNTVRLMATVSVLSLLIALPIGIISAVRQYSILDYVVTTFGFFGLSMPVFWLGLILIIIFGFQFRECFGIDACKEAFGSLPYFPSGGVESSRILPGSIQDVFGVTKGSSFDRIIHLTLPTLMLTFASLASWSRFMRSSMLEVLRQDYVRTARSKGLREYLVIVKHAARNALIPVITIVVFEIPAIFSGAVLTESVFSYPGIGRLFIGALGGNDWPIVMAILYISAILVVFATLVGDILYTLIDPRIRFD